MKKLYTWFLSLFLCGLSLAQDAPTLNIERALEMGLARPYLQSLLDGNLALAESELIRQKTWDNPELMLSMEDIDQGAFGARENYLLFSQRVELLGARKLRTQAAQHHLNVATQQNREQMLQTKALIQERFYAALYAQSRANVLSKWAGLVSEVAEVIAIREEAGVVSGYDRRRLQRELADARAMTAREQASHRARWEKLSAFLGLEDVHTLEGKLLPPMEKVELNIDQHPKLLALEESLLAAALQEKAASKWQLPEVTFEAGMKTTDIGGEKDSGFYFSARVPVPTFNRNKAQQMKARARSMVTLGEKVLTRTRLEGEVRALNAQIRLQREAIQEFRENALTTSDELVDIATTAYEAGEIQILALVDAYQSSRDAQLQLLAMEAENRQLAIQLEALRGAL